MSFVTQIIIYRIRLVYVYMELRAFLVEYFLLIKFVDIYNIFKYLGHDVTAISISEERFI